MSLSGISASPVVAATTNVDASTLPASVKAPVPFGVGTTAAGGHIAQGGGPGQAGGMSLITKMLIGGAVGAGVGFAASFFTLPVIGQVAAPIAAAVGAGIGAVGGLAVHLIGQRRQKLAMEAQGQGAVPQGMAPTPMPVQGVALRPGARGPAARQLQTNLQNLGLYDGKLTGQFDAATQQAVRKYEVMKGVVPTGAGSAEVRAAVAQDAALVRQYV
jgi:hypothetical protein